MSILITGAAGFIGSRLLRKLVARGDDVCILARQGTKMARIEDLLPKIRVIEGDMKDVESVQRCIEEIKPSGIFHLAASNIQSGVTAGKEDVVQTNVLGMLGLLEAVRDLPYTFFVHTGSYLEYGPKEEPMRETDRCEPMELYALSKLSATLLGQAEGHIHKEPVVTVRIFSPYGPGMQKGRLIEQVILKAFKGEDIPMTRLEVARDFIYVDDIADVLIAASERAVSHPGAIFHAASGESTTLEALVGEILKQTKSKSSVRWNAFPPVIYDTPLCQANMAHTFQSLDWKPAHSLQEGLAETIEWYRSHLP